MRRVIGWIAVFVIGFGVAVLMGVWSLQNESVLQYMANLGGLVVGVFVAALVAWFLFPILDKEDEE